MSLSNFSAIDSRTGKVIFSQAGNVTEQAFRDTLSSLFPNIPRSEITIIVDGRTVETGGGRSSPSNAGKSVFWQGVFTDLGGYANMNREITSRLAGHGFNVKLNIMRSPPQVDPDTMHSLNLLAGTKLVDEHSCPMVIGFTPMPVQGRGRRIIYYTMMETQGLHNEFAARCNKYPTEIWVPCRFYLDIFKKAGISKPMHLIPLGVNEKIYTPDAKEPAVRYREMPSGRIVDHLPNKFRFMSLFGWSHRKGPDVLCRSFLREFKANEDACLVIYARHWGQIAEEIQGYYKEMSEDSLPTIYWCGETVPIRDLPGCYAAADCFVFCSRGEGFGLPVVEAGACGIPVISTYNTAMETFLDENTALLVHTDELEAADERLTRITTFYQNQFFPKLGEKAISEVRRHMRAVYSSPIDAKERAGRFRKMILEKFTWDICAGNVAARLMSQ